VFERAKNYYRIGAANGEDLAEVQEKLQLITRLAQSGDVATQLVKFAQKSCLRLDPIQPKVGTEYLQPLLDAADAGRVVSLTYQSIERQEPRTYTFEPVLLTEYAYRWYVCGFYVEEQQTRVFALDRIKALAPLDKPAERPYPQAHYRQMLDPVIGITLNTKAAEVDVVLKVTPKQLRYLSSVPLHLSQRVDGELVHLRIRPNVEFYQQIISLGKEVEVLAPKVVRAEVAAQIKATLAMYEGER
jgi:predicted DNA-binding transcriptional regulator YafY